MPSGDQLGSAPSSTTADKSAWLAPRESCRDTRHRDSGYMAEAGTIGRMTPADCGTTAHQDRTAQVRIAGREDRSSPCRNWHVAIPSLFTLRRRPDPKTRRSMFPKKPLKGLTPISCATTAIIPHWEAKCNDYDRTVIKPESTTALESKGVMRRARTSSPRSKDRGLPCGCSRCITRMHIRCVSGRRACWRLAGLGRGRCSCPRSARHRCSRGPRRL